MHAPVLNSGMNNREPAEGLAGKLDAWKVAPPVPADFQREVWQRIATREAAREEPHWPDPASMVDLLTRRIYALAAVGLSLGIALVYRPARSRWPLR